MFLFNLVLYNKPFLFASCSIEEDFLNWREKFWPAVCEHFGIEATGEDVRYVTKGVRSGLKGDMQKKKKKKKIKI